MTSLPPTPSLTVARHDDRSAVPVGHVDVIEQLLRLTDDTVAVAAVADVLHAQGQAGCQTSDGQAQAKVTIGRVLAGRAGGAVPAGTPVAALLTASVPAPGWRDLVKTRPGSAWARFVAAGGQPAAADATCQQVVTAVIDVLDTAEDAQLTLDVDRLLGPVR